jgi:lipopolysaccharide/colanic/teichoic acid biosynthesis glycosyltransferase
MVKFRKMGADAAGPPLTVAGDVRFTRLGRLLAASKLDELPQLWNVLKGDMSLVGPRPEDPSFVALREDDYAEVLRVRPGITGLSQLAFVQEGRILDPYQMHDYYIERLQPQKIHIDKLYARQCSLALNLSILLWTIVAVAFKTDVAVNRTTGKLRIRRRPSRVQEAPELADAIMLAQER